MFKIINKNKVKFRNIVLNLLKVVSKVLERIGEEKKEWEQRSLHLKY